MFFPPELAIPAVATIALARRATRRDDGDRNRGLELFEGVAAIVARDKRPRAKRAMDVLRLLRQDSLAPPPHRGSSE